MFGAVSDRILRLLPSRRRYRSPDRPGLGLQAFTWTMLVLISAPTILMIPLSFGSGGLNWPPQGFTLHWYETVLQSPVWTQALLRSLMVGLGTGLLAMLIGTPAAFLLVRSEIPGKAPHDHLALTGGAIGQGIPVATGAAVACPDRKVVCLHGDGGAMYTLQALWTQARESLDVTTVDLCQPLLWHPQHRARAGRRWRPGTEGLLDAGSAQSRAGLGQARIRHGRRGEPREIG